MRRLALIIFLASLYVASATKETCSNKGVSQEECENLTSEYEKYRECMERRSKRSIGCQDDYEDECEDCDCGSCNTCHSCRSNSCCNTCCQTKSVCNTYNCCHKSCRAECKSSSCRSSCKQRCTDTSERIVSAGRAGSVNSTASLLGAHNITTIIHLNNIINNTNLIHLPVNVNNTNVNNITVESSGPGSFYGGGESNCCETIGPRQCVPDDKPPYARCYHVRKNVCGNLCTAPFVHFQKHQICDNPDIQQSCKQQIISIPQPQPRCAYQQQWPYVACGNQNYHSCGGCYDHYINKADIPRCSNFCYDDGFGTGPYYRQGPFFRQGYSHLASCFQTGFCGDLGGQFGGGFGGGYYPEPELGNAIGSIPFNGLGYPPWSYGWDANSQNPVGTSVNVTEIVPNPLMGAKVEWMPKLSQGAETQFESLRTQRYAEIKIKPTESSVEETGEELKEGEKKTDETTTTKEA